MKRSILAVVSTLVALPACTSGGSDAVSAQSVANNAPPPVPGDAAQPVVDNVAPTGPALYLQALSATSGNAAESLLDSNLTTVWRPSGDPADEGVLLRFEEPQSFKTIAIAGCGGDTIPEMTVYLDGRKVETEAQGRGTATLTLTPRIQSGFATVRSIFLKLGAKPGACLAELTLSDPGGLALPARPPRSAAGTVKASSVLKPADAYHPSYLFDQRTDFGWVEGADGTGGGQTLTVSFQSPRTITGLQIWNGYQRSADHFKKNARVKTLMVTAEGYEAQTLAVADTMGSQNLKLKEPIETRQITLTIGDTAPGSRYPDLVISELRFIDETGPFTVKTPDMQQRQAALKAELKGKPLGDVIDRQLTPVCNAGEEDYVFTEGSLKLRSNHSFVFYDRVNNEMESEVYTEVFDGAWVVSNAAPLWSEIKLYGRRHRIAETWAPYTGNNVSESTRVSGGTVKIARVVDLGEAGLRNLLADWQKRGVGQATGGCAAMDPSSDTFPATVKGLIDRRAVVVEGKAMVGIYGSPGK